VDNARRKDGAFTKNEHMEGGERDNESDSATVRRAAQLMLKKVYGLTAKTTLGVWIGQWCARSRGGNSTGKIKKTFRAKAAH